MIADIILALGYWLWLPAVVLIAYRTYDYYRLHSNIKLVGTPVLELSKFPSMVELLEYGCAKYKSSAFQIVTAQETIVCLPTTLYNEAEALGIEAISLTEDTKHRFLHRWTFMGDDRPEVTDTVRQELTRSLDRILASGILAEEVQYCLDHVIEGDSSRKNTQITIGDDEKQRILSTTTDASNNEWWEVPIYTKLLDSVSMISGRIFVGLPLSRTREWIDISVGYTRDVVTTGINSKRWNPILRPLVAPFLASTRRCRTQQANMQELMRPLVEAAIAQRSSTAAAANGGEGESEKKQRRTTAARSDNVGLLEEGRGMLVSWLLNHLPASQQTVREVAIDQLIMGFAAIHTTSTSTTFALFNLATMQEVVEELREEIRQVAKQDGLQKDQNGITVWPKQSITKLWKLDSFLKESQRMTPMGYTTPVKKVCRDITFSNGLHLPKYTRVVFPAWHVHHSPETLTFSPSYNDGTGNKPPTEFDALRFYRLRQVPGNDHKHQAMTTGLDSLTFGHGKHACPGRFFAMYQSKMILIAMIEKYDMRASGNLAPKTFNVDISRHPDPTAKIELRKRREA